MTEYYKEREGGKKEKFAFIYARNMPPYSKIDRRHKKKTWHRNQSKE